MPRGGMRRARPGACTSATRARRCSPGSTRAAAAARSSCASRISIARACRRAQSRASSTISPGWASTGTRAPIAAGPFAPYRQSERTARYDAAIDRLLADGRAFPCACSRADVARAAQAPHERTTTAPAIPAPAAALAADEVRARAAAQGRAPAVRFAGGGARIDFVDEVHGAVPADAAGIDDFVLRRADGTAAYQLAVVVDDAAMAVTHVVRGRRSAALDAAPARALPRARAGGAAVRARAAGADRLGRAPRQADAAGGDRRPARAGRLAGRPSSAPWRRPRD